MTNKVTALPCNSPWHALDQLALALELMFVYKCPLNLAYHEI